MLIKKISFVIIIIVSVVITQEAMLRILCFAIPSINAKFGLVVLDKKLGFVRPIPNSLDRDKRGWRNKNVPARVSIVALGDSQTYGLGVALSQAWPQQLEEISKISTYNMAYGSYGPVHSLCLWQEAVSMKPKLIIEAFYAGNDLYDSYNLVYGEGRFKNLKTCDPNILKSIKYMDNIETLQDRVSFLYNDGRKIRKHLPLEKFLAAHSKIYILLVKIINKFKSFKKTQLLYENFNDGKFLTVFMPDYRLEAINLNDSRIAEGLRISLEAMNIMNDNSRKENIKFIVLLIPTKELVFKNLVPIGFSDVYRKHIESEEMLFRKMREFLQSHQVDFVDALPFLRKAFLLGEQPYPVNQDGHPNEIGHYMIAEGLSYKIKELYGNLSPEDTPVNGK